MTPPEPPRTPYKSFEVPPEHAGKRLDRFLVESLPELSRARVKALIDAGEVRVDGHRVRKGGTVHAGARVDVLSAPPPKDFSPVAQAELRGVVVRHEDEAVAVLEKPSGMPTHPLSPEETGTLANFVIARFPETAEVGFARREPGLLHRLDTDTSGLVIVARSQAAFESLREASRAGQITKKYLAVVEGTVASEGRVDYPLVPHRKDPKRVEAVTPHVRLRAGTKTHEAHTNYRPVRALRGAHGTEYTLVEVEIATAFRHQIRVHLATVGHPLLGDALYRGPAPDAGVPLARHFLHASEVVFPHPTTGATVHVTSPLPNDLAATLAKLGG